MLKIAAGFPHLDIHDVMNENYRSRDQGEMSLQCVVKSVTEF